MFTQFTDLPPEIRTIIWQWCLPARIVELEDFPHYKTRSDHDSSGSDSDSDSISIWTYDTEVELYNPEPERCDSWKLMNHGSRRPLIASVCKEARRVAEQCGSIRPFHHPHGLRSVWLQPKLDTLHVAWKRYRYLDVDNWSGTTKPTLDKFFAEALQSGIPISMPGDPLYEVSFGRRPADGSVDVLLGNTSSDIEADIICKALPPGALLEMVLVCVHLHVPEQRARESGLFGLLGDAPVQTVAFDDKRRLEQFHNLSKNSGFEHADADAAEQLDIVFSAEFDKQCAEWSERVEWALMLHLWLTDVSRGELPYSLAGEVWNNPITVTPDTSHYFSLEDDLFVEHNPWVQKTKLKLPNLLPKVMFRLCPFGCNAKEAATSDDRE